LVIASTAAQLEQENAALQAAKKQLATQNLDPPKLTSLLLEQLHRQQLDKLAQLTNLLSHSSAAEAEVIRLNSEIKNLDGIVQNEMQRLLAEQTVTANRSLWLEREIEGWRAQFLEKKKTQLEKMLAAYEQSQKASASKAPVYEVTETSLRREVDQARELYQLFLHQAQGSEMQAALRNAQNEYHYRILEPAQIPLHSNSMSTFRKLLIAGAVGFILGLLLAFRLEGLNRTFMTVEEVSEQVQLPVVGLMPKLQKKGFQFELDGKDTLEVQRVTTRIMKHLPAGNLQIDKFPADKQRTLLITSSIDTEGKSTFAAHLAANLAAFQKWPVLLIDADLRRPEQHRLFKVDNQSGLMNLLEDNNAVSALLASTQYENLSVLPSGRLQGTPLELFTSKRFASALAELKKEFAFIIIDAPPVIPVNDTLLLSRHANSILYMVKAGVTPRNIVKRGVDLLVNAGGSNLGIVLNNLKQVLPYYYQPNYLSANGSVKRSS
jgi:capsular exopolysaccharide synthesis family protein